MDLRTQPHLEKIQILCFMSQLQVRISSLKGDTVFEIAKTLQEYGWIEEMFVKWNKINEFTRQDDCLDVKRLERGKRLGWTTRWFLEARERACLQIIGEQKREDTMLTVWTCRKCCGAGARKRSFECRAEYQWAVTTEPMVAKLSRRQGPSLKCAIKPSASHEPWEVQRLMADH